jgi:hypothetical protein
MEYLNKEFINELSSKIYKCLTKNSEQDILNTIPKEAFKNKDFVLSALPKIRRSSHITFMEYVHDTIKNDKEIGLELIKINPLIIEKLNSELLNDENVILNIIKDYPHALKYASDDLKNNRNFIFKFVETVDSMYLGICSTYFPEEFINSKEVALKMVKRNGFMLNDLIKEFKDDKEIVREALRKSAGAIEYTSVRLKDDKELALLVVRRNGCLMEYLSNRLKGSAEVALEAYLSTTDSIKFFSHELKKELEDKKGKEIVEYLEKKAFNEALENELNIHGENHKKLKL